MKPARDPAYLAWVRRHACIVCGKGGAEAHHLEPNTARRGSDYRTIPLCAGHHRHWSDSAHNISRTFAAVHGLDIERIVNGLNQGYLDEHLEGGTVPDGLIVQGGLPRREDLTAEAA